MLKLTMLFVATFALSACQHTGTPPTVTDTSCVVFKPIYPSKRDVLVRETKEQIVVHNKKYRTRCNAPA
jgi:hypothetical protein